MDKNLINKQSGIFSIIIDKDNIELNALFVKKAIENYCNIMDSKVVKVTKVSSMIK